MESDGGPGSWWHSIFGPFYDEADRNTNRNTNMNTQQINIDTNDVQAMMKHRDWLDQKIKEADAPPDGWTLWSEGAWVRDVAGATFYILENGKVSWGYAGPKFSFLSLSRRDIAQCIDRMIEAMNQKGVY